MNYCRTCHIYYASIDGVCPICGTFDGGPDR